MFFFFSQFQEHLNPEGNFNELTPKDLNGDQNGKKDEPVRENTVSKDSIENTKETRNSSSVKKNTESDISKDSEIDGKQSQYISETPPTSATIESEKISFKVKMKTKEISTLTFHTTNRGFITSKAINVRLYLQCSI